ncbi:MAG: hypothetical protein GEV12_07245 [Micromonosporaceae bacterium]|nr:hypothetical protein [Micromonosporaceae bacterium]
MSLAAAVLTVGLVGVLLVPAPWTAPTPPPASPPTGVGQPPLTDPAEALLRERLGGLGSLLIGDDPLLQACADPGTAPPALAEPASLAAVTAHTEALRRRELVESPDIQLLPDAEMTARVARSFRGRAEPAQVDLDTRALTGLGAIQPGTDLGSLRVDAFAEQVNGYHLGEQGVIGVRAADDDPDRLRPLERVVLAHELEHALSFQHLGRPSDSRDGDESTDARLASAALVEGSATTTMLHYATAVLTPAQQAVLRGDLRLRAGQGALAGYSPYLLAELQFPYREGLRYTCRRWLAGGWDEVEAGYRDPPASTAAVLFPERHGEQPRRPATLADPGGPWEHARTSSFGAAELEWLLTAPGGEVSASLDQPRQRVSAWDGGELAVWTNGDATAVGLALVDRGGGPALCDTVRQWYAAAFPRASQEQDGTRVRFDGPRQDAVLACPGSQVRLGIAPTATVAATITAP